MLALPQSQSKEHPIKYVAREQDLRAKNTKGASFSAPSVGTVGVRLGSKVYCLLGTPLQLFLVDWIPYVGLSMHSVVVLQQCQNQEDGFLGMESLEACVGDLSRLAINPEFH